MNTYEPTDTEADTSSYKPKCPFLKVISEKSIQCLGFDCKILGDVDFSDTRECSEWANGKCFDKFLDCEHYRKYYSDPQIIRPEDKQCIRCCNSSWYMGLPDGYNGQKYCFCQRKQTPMLHDNHCEWFDRHPGWPLEPTEKNGSQFKEDAGMGKMSTANIMDAMKKARQKTDTLKFAPHPEDLPLQTFIPHPHNEFAKQDTAADIEEMRENLESIGLINPIAVSHRDGKYYILSGECRYRAILLINAANPEKYNYVRSTVYENLTPAQEMLILNSANLKARSYTAAQRLAYFQSLKNFLEAEKAAGRYDGPMQADIAESMGMSDRQVRKYEQINEQFTDAEKQKIVDGEMSVDAAAKEAVARRQEKKDKATGSASGQRPNEKNQKTKSEQPGAKPDLVSPELPLDTVNPAERTSTFTDDLYQRAYDDVLVLMEALQGEDSAAYDEVAQLFGKLMNFMRKKGHKLDMGDAESAIDHGKD